MNINVKQFIDSYRKNDTLNVLYCNNTLQKEVTACYAERPGLSLAGFTTKEENKRALVFGRIEIEYLKSLSSSTRHRHLKHVLTSSCPFIFISRNIEPIFEMVELCKEKGIGVFQTNIRSMDLLAKINTTLGDLFAATESIHATLM